MIGFDNMIDEWYKRYGIDRDDVLWRYGLFDKPKTMGRTTYLNQHYAVIHRWAVIWISETFRNRPLMTKAILWHEFCHAEQWIKHGMSDHHGVGFLRRQLRKPVLFLLDYSVCRWYNRIHH